tara:strand:- start:1241 stop:2071 length:831 start_codon:yes stop_codon:yes gene_type:complete
MYKNIVFSGGGIKLLCHIGFLEYLEENNLLDNIENYSASSIGCVIILCLVLDYKIKEIKEFLIKLNFFKSINIDVDNIINYISDLGIDDGTNFRRIVEIIIRKKSIDASITMGELYELNKKNIIFAVSNINTNKTEYLNYKDTPNVKVIDAIMMSCSFPFYFVPITMNNSKYIDGGLFNNYPINVFEDDLEHTIGCNIIYNETNNDISDILSYTLHILTTLNDKLCKLQMEKYLDNTVIICCNKSSFNIKLDTNDKHELIKLGYNNTKEYFEKQNK